MEWGPGIPYPHVAPRPVPLSLGIATDVEGLALLGHARGDGRCRREKGTGAEM